MRPKSTSGGDLIPGDTHYGGRRPYVFSTGLRGTVDGQQTGLAGMVEQSPRRGADMMRSRVPQFRFTAVAVEDTDGRHSVVSRANHVVAAVAYHHGLRRVDAH